MIASADPARSGGRLIDAENGLYELMRKKLSSERGRKLYAQRKRLKRASYEGTEQTIPEEVTAA